MRNKVANVMQKCINNGRTISIPATNGHDARTNKK